MLFRRRKPAPLVSPAGATPLRDRIDLLRHLAARASCTSYLEIGCNRDKVFDKIEIEHKIGVDPRRGGTHRITSDEYFKQNDRTFDLVLIDGLHQAEQVLRDVDNSLAALNEHGAIVLHDCNPLSEEAQLVPPDRRGGPWNGDVWKAVVVLRGRPDVDLAVGDFDYGCGVLFSRPNGDPLEIDQTLETLTFAGLDENRKKWLRLMASDELIAFIDSR